MEGVIALTDRDPTESVTGRVAAPSVVSGGGCSLWELSRSILPFLRRFIDQSGQRTIEHDVTSDRTQMRTSMSKLPNDHAPNIWWLLLLLVLVAGVLWIPPFKQVDPEIWGVPSFTWYQLLWISVSVLVTSLVIFKATPRPRLSQQTRQAQHRE
jgi:hypothetical protein